MLSLTYENKRKSPEVAASPERKQCPDHGEEITMFCRESGCEKAICHLCLVKSHKFHDVVDFEEERKDNYRSLVKDIEGVSKILVMNKKKIQAIQKNFEKRHEQSLKMLKLRKEEVVRKIIEHIDQLWAKLSEDNTDQDRDTEGNRNNRNQH